MSEVPPPTNVDPENAVKSRTIAAQKFRYGNDGRVEDVTEPRQEPGHNPPATARTLMHLRPHGPGVTAVDRGLDDIARAAHNAAIRTEPSPRSRLIADVRRGLSNLREKFDEAKARRAENANEPGDSGGHQR